MRQLIVSALATILIMGSVGHAGPDRDRDAIALVDKALVMFKEKGRKETLHAINSKNGPFVQGELYVFALTMENIVVGHPFEHSLRRLNCTNVKDKNGVMIFKKFNQVVQDQGSGWVDYMWGRLGAENPSRKRAFLKKVPDEDLYVGVGFFVE